MLVISSADTVEKGTGQGKEFVGYRKRERGGKPLVYTGTRFLSYFAFNTYTNTIFWLAMPGTIVARPISLAQAASIHEMPTDCLESRCPLQLLSVQPPEFIYLVVR